MLSVPPELARIVLQFAPDALIIVDALGMILFVNAQMSALFDYPHDELVGQPIEILVPERVRHTHARLRTRYMRRAHRRTLGEGLDISARKHDGTEFPIEVRLNPVEYDNTTFVAAAIRDASTRKRIESELLSAHAAAEQAREVAVRADQAKSRFLATASHDLRQPLQSLALLNGTLRRMARDADSSIYITQQEQAIKTMSRLLNALLDISKLESGAVKPIQTNFVVDEMFAELHREFASLATRKELALEVESTGQVAHSDPALVEQLLRNLVSNAIKYTPSGKVTLRCTRAPDAKLRIDVHDTGIGIPAEQLSRIYDEFYQITTADGRYDGYGLGLTIVRRIVDLLGLRLEIDSQVGVGSCFALVIPAAAATTGEQPRARVPEVHRSTEARAHQQRIILVEDDTGVRDATRMLLKIEGYRVAAVASLEEALAAASEGIDLLVTDYHLRGGQTGTEVMAALRSSFDKHLRCVLITGDTSNSIGELPQDPHVRVARKPVEAEQLLALLGALSGEHAPSP